MIATFTHARGGCGAEAGGFWNSRSATVGMFTHTRSGRGADAGGSAISWGQWWFGARGFDADAANWVLDPFLAERFLLPLRHRSATAHVWTHVMICVEANFPPASARARPRKCERTLWIRQASTIACRVACVGLLAYLSLALVNVHRVCDHARSAHVGACFFYLWWRSFESISGTGGRLADLMASTNVSSTEFTLSAVTSGAWVMRTISFSLLIQSSLLMFVTKFSFSRSSHKNMCYTVKYRSIIIIPDPR